MKRQGLLDRAAACLGCHCIPDLSYLTQYQRCILATHIEDYDVEQYSLLDWNDALEYLCRKSSEATEIAAKEALLAALRYS